MILYRSDVCGCDLSSSLQHSLQELLALNSSYLKYRIRLDLLSEISKSFVQNDGSPLW